MHPFTDRYFFAFAALFFALILFVLLAVYGGHYTRAAVALAAFAGLISQHMAQSHTGTAIHSAATVVGMVAALWAIILFALGY